MEQVFCVEVIEPVSNWRAEHGVLHSLDLQLTGDAHIAAQQITATAQDEAENVLLAAKTEAMQAIQRAEQEVWQRARNLLESIEQEHTQFMQRAESLVLDLTQVLFERLICETSPRERLIASLRRIQQEAPARLVQAILHVNPADMELLPDLEWQVKADTALTPGSCRLEAECGVWSASFDLAVLSLQAGLEQKQEVAVAKALTQAMDID